jgi:2,3-bisphosphoglycerate-independent phosphoglycerate mutase
MNKKPVLLIILDGFGLAPKTKYNAIAQANTPHLDSWFAQYPHATLQASGAAVGLPAGSIGNSEVGHLTIGAGRIIEQPESFILQSIGTCPAKLAKPACPSKLEERSREGLDKRRGDGSFYKNPILQTHLQELKKKGKALHIIGLLSDAGVHCTESIIFAFIQAAADAGIDKIFVHPILDGRDVAPKSAAIYLQRLDEFLRTIPQARIGSLHGRFYAMDRDNNWERTEKSYGILTSAYGSMILARKARRLLTTNGLDNSYPFALSFERSPDTSISSVVNDPSTIFEVLPVLSLSKDQRVAPSQWPQVLESNYAAGITDEFIPPINLDPKAIVSNGDGIIFANYRPDRARQLTECFVAPKFSHFEHKNSDPTQPFVLSPSCTSGLKMLRPYMLRPLEASKDIQLEFFITPVSYGSQIHTTIMYPQQPITNTLKEILSHAGKTIFSIAETEKYAHITYFFDGGRETQFPGETRVLIPSLHTRTYIANPEMSAPAITQAALKSLRENPSDFYLINYANADMVGHSGDFEATKKAIEILDAQLAQLFKVVVEEMHGTMFITADHGNAEDKSNTPQPHTAHTANPVPFLMLNESNKNGAAELPLNQLADIAGFVLRFMGIN